MDQSQLRKALRDLQRKATSKDFTHMTRNPQYILIELPD